MRNVYKVLAEKYESLYEVREIRQIPFSDDELSLLTKQYKFKQEKDKEPFLTRIAAPGQTEEAVKYSDGTVVHMITDGRGTIKKEYKDYQEFVQGLPQLYTPNYTLAQKQTPYGVDTPYGVTSGGQQ